MSMAIEAGICEEAWDSEDDECGPMSAPAITRTSGHGADGEPSFCLCPGQLHIILMAYRGSV